MGTEMTEQDDNKAIAPFDALETESLRQRGIPFDKVKALLDHGYSKEQTWKICDGHNLKEREIKAHIDGSVRVYGDASYYQRNKTERAAVDKAQDIVRNAEKEAREASNKAANVFNKTINELTKETTNPQVVGALLNEGVSVKDILKLSRETTEISEDLLGLYRATQDLTWTLEAYQHAHPVKATEIPLDLLIELYKTPTGKENYTLIVKASREQTPDKDPIEAIREILDLVTQANSLDINIKNGKAPNDKETISNIWKLKELNWTEREISEQLTYYTIKRLLEMTSLGGKEKVQTLLGLKLWYEWENRILKNEMTIEQVQKANDLKISESVAVWAVRENIELTKAKEWLDSGVEAPLLPLYATGKIDKETIEKLREYGIDSKLAIQALSEGLSVETIDATKALLLEGKRNDMLSGWRYLKKAGYGEAELLRIVHAQKANNPKWAKLDLSREDYASTYELSKLGYAIETTGWRVEAYKRGLSGKVSEDTFWGIIEIIDYIATEDEEERLLDLRRGNLDENTTKDRLKTLNKIAKREKGPRPYRYGWSGGTLTLKQGNEKAMRPQPQQIDRTIGSGTLKETYTRIGLVVDWYATVLTDPIWSMDNIPALIDRRSPLYSQIESQLVKVQDHPLMKGTLNPNLDDDTLHTPTPRDFQKLAEELEIIMNDAWKQAQTLGTTYPIDESKGPEDKERIESDDLDIQAAELRLQVRKDERLLGILRQNTTDTVDGQLAHEKALKLEQAIKDNQVAAINLERQARRLDMGSDQITRKVRLLAANPRLADRDTTKELGH